VLAAVTVTREYGEIRLPDGGFQFVSMTVSGEHGPHPELDSGFKLFCNVLIPALT
jgi:hypothetical protein